MRWAAPWVLLAALLLPGCGAPGKRCEAVPLDEGEGLATCWAEGVPMVATFGFRAHSGQTGVTLEVNGTAAGHSTVQPDSCRVFANLTPLRGATCEVAGPRTHGAEPRPPWTIETDWQGGGEAFYMGRPDQPLGGIQVVAFDANQAPVAWWDSRQQARFSWAIE